MLVGEKYRKYTRDVKVIPWKLQHRLVVVDLEQKILKKVERKQRNIRKNWKLNENRTRVIFEKRVHVKKTVSTDVPSRKKALSTKELLQIDVAVGKAVHLSLSKLFK